MCKEMYVEAKSLECRYLSSETPCGLFVVSNYGSEPSSFLIVGAKNRYAVMLGDHADHSFRVMKLEEHTRN